MDSNLKRQEQASLDAIGKYIKRKIMSETEYLQEKKKRNAEEEKERLKVSPEIEHFWEACMKCFRKKMEHLFPMDTEKSVSEETEPGAVCWYDYIDYFEATFNVVRQKCIDKKCDRLDRKYVELVKEYNFSKSEIEKLDHAFLLIETQLNEGRKDDTCWEKLVFGRIDFNGLKYLLDLRDKEVRKLLPYLLTAYTCRARDSRYFSGVQTTMKVLKSNPPKGFDCTDANKLVLSSKKLIKVFSLSQYHVDSICSLNQNKHNHDGPEPLIWENVLHRARAKEVPVPLIRYKELAEDILELWVSAINKTASIAKIDGFPEDIDLEMCRALFNHHCADDGQNEPGK